MNELDDRDLPHHRPARTALHNLAREIVDRWKISDPSIGRALMIGGVELGLAIAELDPEFRQRLYDECVEHWVQTDDRDATAIRQMHFEGYLKVKGDAEGIAAEPAPAPVE